MIKTPVQDEITRQKNARNGIAGLDSDGKLDVAAVIREGDISNDQLGDTLRAASASEQALSVTTLTNNDDLVINLDASSTYIFRMALFFRCAGASEGFKAALNGTVGVDSLKAQILVYDDSTDSLEGFGRVEAFGASVGATISAGDGYCTIEGSITTTSTAGTFRLQWGQNAGAGASATALETNSYMRVEKV